MLVLLEEVTVKVWVPNTTCGAAEAGLKFCPEMVIVLCV
jgi:hypothetical protein